MAGMKTLRKIGRRLWAAHIGFQAHEGTLSASGIAYYVALSFFPLLLVLVAGLASLLAWTKVGEDAQHRLLAAIGQQVSPDLAHQVGRILDVVKERAPANGPIGFVVLIASAIAIFAQLDSAFDRIWRLPTDPHASWWSWLGRLLFQRLKALGMLIGVGGFIVLTTVTSMVWSAMRSALEPTINIEPWAQWGINLGINLLLNWCAFAIIYRVLPKATILWWEAIGGGLLAAVLWEIGRQALAAYVLHLNYPSAYGIIGSFIAVMLWAYYAALVLLFGAEYVRAIGEERVKVPT